MAPDKMTAVAGRLRTLQNALGPPCEESDEELLKLTAKLLDQFGGEAPLMKWLIRYEEQMARMR
jgi:hypothetical protein